MKKIQTEKKKSEMRKRTNVESAEGAKQTAPVADVIIHGTVTLAGSSIPLAGVTVVASMPTEPLGGLREAHADAYMQFGRAITDSDGGFTIMPVQEDPIVTRWLCALQHCSEFKFRIECLDTDRTLLHQTDSIPYYSDSPMIIAVPEPDQVPLAEDWSELGELLSDSKIVRLNDVVRELTTLNPRQLFRDWSIQKRLAVLGSMEQALLDPNNEFGNTGMQIRFWKFDDETEIENMRDELLRHDQAGLIDSLEKTVERARKIGSWAEFNPPGDADKFKQGDYVSAVNRFIEEPGSYADAIDTLTWPTIGYRDYLRDRWVNVHRSQAGAAIMIQRFNNRFHQDFTTRDVTDQPVNRLLANILLRMLTAPNGTSYGFGILAANIEPLGDRSHRDYVDYLISVTGFDRSEIGNRYRLNLDRSDFEQSNPVQLNIETLQRFFTDSYQSEDDPFAVKPDRIAGKDEKQIVEFPREAAGPFFLQYEEWLAREGEFYPENHYDPRKTYVFNTDVRSAEKARDVVFANSIPLPDFLNEKNKQKFVPDGTNHVAVKWQWVRNHLELQDLINSAHDDAKSLNYPGAEEKFARAKEWSGKMRAFINVDWDYMSKQFTHWAYKPASTMKEQKKADVSTIEKLQVFENRYHLYLGWHYGVIPEYGDINPGNPREISAKWWGERPDLFPGPGHRATVAYLVDHVYFRLLPACLSDIYLAQSKFAQAMGELVGRSHIYRQSEWWFNGPAGFNVFAATLEWDNLKQHTVGGPLPYASASDRTQEPLWDDPHIVPDIPPTSVPTNRAELGYFKLKLGNVALEWADVLYRSNEPEKIMRARELYKAVLFLHHEDPEITPNWEAGNWNPSKFPWKQSSRNPAITSQVGRGRLGFVQINAGLNYYGLSHNHVPPTRHRVLKEAADSLVAGAKGAQTDFLNYMQQLDLLTVSEMQARTMVTKANAAMNIAQEQQKIAEFHVGEAQKQVDAINGQIAAKKAEIANKDEFFEQAKDFAGGMKDSVGKLGEMAFAGNGGSGAVSAQQLSTSDIVKLGFKIGTASNALGGATSALSGAAGVAGPFGAFLYAGVTSMSSMADAIAKRAGELAHLQNVALPAAKALVDLKKRDVKIAELSGQIAKADSQLGTDLLKYYTQRFQNRSFLISMTEFSNRLMRRYLDMAGKMAWMAERALAFEQDRQFGIIGFDYFPRNLRGVSGTDVLALNLAELESARIHGLAQTIPVKETISLARDFPVQFGQLKKNGSCSLATSEAPLQLAYPGVYGYRVKNITVALAYAGGMQPHRGLLSNQGISIISRDKPGTAHTLTRYADALPLSDFQMRNDMWVFDLPDETLLPFEGSGFESVWDVMLSKFGKGSSLAALTDVLITFDMRARYSALLHAQHIAAMPNTANRALMVSANEMNPGGLAKFRKDGGQLALAFDLAKIARNKTETQRKVTNLTLVAVGADDGPFEGSFTSANSSETITFEKGIAISNAGVLADGNNGVPLPLNTFVGEDIDQPFKLVLDSAENPGTKFGNLTDILLLAEYQANV
jgi:hypothetical protein